MPDASKYNLEFRPDSYWGTQSPVQSLLHCVKGEQRRRWVLQKLQEGKVDEVESWMLADKLDDDVLCLLCRIDPQLMGGEYLPDYAQDEVEIARIFLKSSLGDVIGIRARPEGNRIQYRIVDE